MMKIMNVNLECTRERERGRDREFKNVSTKQILVYYEKGLIRNITTTRSNNYNLKATYEHIKEGRKEVRKEGIQDTNIQQTNQVNKQENLANS